jgi:hypothetical protein
MTNEILKDRRAKLMRIAKAIPKLNVDDPSQFTGDGKPTTRALGDMIGEDVSADERNEVWAAHLEALEQTKGPDVEEHEPEPEPDLRPGERAANGDDGINDMPYGGKWAVMDMNATRKPRRHQPVVDGPEYQLNAKTPKEMPREHAVKFLSDPSFKVFNEYGAHVPDLPSAESLRAGQDRKITLAPNEVVAKLHELTDEAVLTRCQRFPNGERLTKRTKRADLEDFLIEAMQRRAKGVPDEKIGADAGLEDDGGRGYQFTVAGR